MVDVLAQGVPAGRGPTRLQFGHRGANEAVAPLLETLEDRDVGSLALLERSTDIRTAFVIQRIQLDLQLFRYWRDH